MQAMNAAVVGTGFIGPVHVEGLIRAGVNVRGILGSSPLKSTMAAAKLGLAKGYESLIELLADPQIAVVHIASPNQSHYPQVLACLAAGKHVLCEKPLAMNSKEASHLVEEAARSGLVCGVNYNIRYYPLCLEAAERIRSKSVGDIFHVSGAYVQDWLLYDDDFNWRVSSKEGGALRAIADIGTHWLDLIHSITGLEVESLCADLQTVHPVRQAPVGGAETFTDRSVRKETHSVSIDTEDYGSVMIRFRGGCRGLFHVSQVTAGRKNQLRFEIAGSNNSLAWNSESPNELWIGKREASNELLIRDPALMKGRAKDFASYPGGHNEGFPDTFKQLFRDFYSYIQSDRSKAPQFPTFEDGLREIVLCEAILESHLHRRWVELGRD